MGFNWGGFGSGFASSLDTEAVGKAIRYYTSGESDRNKKKAAVSSMSEAQLDEAMAGKGGGAGGAAGSQPAQVKAAPTTGSGKAASGSGVTTQGTKAAPTTGSAGTGERTWGDVAEAGLSELAKGAKGYAASQRQHANRLASQMQDASYSYTPAQARNLNAGAPTTAAPTMEQAEPAKLVSTNNTAAPAALPQPKTNYKQPVLDKVASVLTGSRNANAGELPESRKQAQPMRDIVPSVEQKTSALGNYAPQGEVNGVPMYNRTNYEYDNKSGVGVSQPTEGADLTRREMQGVGASQGQEAPQQAAEQEQAPVQAQGQGPTQAPVQAQAQGSVPSARGGSGQSSVQAGGGSGINMYSNEEKAAFEGAAAKVRAAEQGMATDPVTGVQQAPSKIDGTPQQVEAATANFQNSEVCRLLGATIDTRFLDNARLATKQDFVNTLYDLDYYNGIGDVEAANNARTTLMRLQTRLSVNTKFQEAIGGNRNSLSELLTYMNTYVGDGTTLRLGADNNVYRVARNGDVLGRVMLSGQDILNARASIEKGYFLFAGGYTPEQYEASVAQNDTYRRANEEHALKMDLAQYGKNKEVALMNAGVVPGAKSGGTGASGGASGGSRYMYEDNKENIDENGRALTSWIKTNDVDNKGKIIGLRDNATGQELPVGQTMETFKQFRDAAMGAGFGQVGTFQDPRTQMLKFAVAVPGTTRIRFGSVDKNGKLALEQGEVDTAEKKTAINFKDPAGGYRILDSNNRNYGNVFDGTVSIDGYYAKPEPTPEEKQEAARKDELQKAVATSKLDNDRFVSDNRNKHILGRYTYQEAKSILDDLIKNRYNTYTHRDPDGFEVDRTTLQRAIKEYEGLYTNKPTPKAASSTESSGTGGSYRDAVAGAVNTFLGRDNPDWSGEYLDEARQNRYGKYTDQESDGYKSDREPPKSALNAVYESAKQPTGQFDKAYLDKVRGQRYGDATGKVEAGVSSVTTALKSLFSRRNPNDSGGREATAEPKKSVHTALPSAKKTTATSTSLDAARKPAMPSLNKSYKRPARSSENAWNLGQTSKKYESGSRGADTISTGRGDRGGKSYGLHQFSLNAGAVKEYLRASKYGKEFNGLTPGSAEFDAKWKQVAKDPGFGEDQTAYVKKRYYEPAMAGLARNGFDLYKRGRAVHDAVWSTATQFGLGGPNMVRGIIPMFMAAFRGKDVAKMSDAEIVSTLQQYKIDNNEKLFASSNDRVRLGTLVRAKKERAALLKLAREDELATKAK